MEGFLTANCSSSLARPRSILNDQLIFPGGFEIENCTQFFLILRHEKKYSFDIYTISFSIYLGAVL